MGRSHQSRPSITTSEHLFECVMMVSEGGDLSWSQPPGAIEMSWHCQKSQIWYHLKFLNKTLKKWKAAFWLQFFLELTSRTKSLQSQMFQHLGFKVNELILFSRPLVDRAKLRTAIKPLSGSCYQTEPTHICMYLKRHHCQADNFRISSSVALKFCSCLPALGGTYLAL